MTPLDRSFLMRRRRWLQLAAAGAAVPWLAGCYSRESSAQARPGFTIGTNLSGMEWPQPGIRKGNSTLPNLHFTPPRKADIAWLAGQGFKRNRLPVLWEMLQPVLADARPNAATRALVGEPGEFHALYAQLITDVLDAHAAAGAKCILDLHNYGRYRDFRYEPDGSVRGLSKGQTPLQRPYTEDPNAVVERIIALAPGATLTQAHFTDFWTRAARRWKDHPGLAGYGLMNEPHDLPKPGQVVASEGGGEDLAIWPAYARAGVEAIRKVDPKTPIYVAGNEWSAATSMGSKNPGFPLAGENLVYEVHLYLDASSSGHAFDYDMEARKGYSAGLGNRPIDEDTAARRLEKAIDWAEDRKVRLALTEVGMPLDDARWQAMFQKLLARAVRHGVEVFSWMGGNHWPARNYPINHVPGWYQGRTLVPAVAGPMQQAASIAQATLYDEVAPAAPGEPVTVTVSARGNLAQPLTLQVASDAGGRFSKTALTIPAGANGADSFTFTPEPDRVATLAYSGGANGVALPPARRIAALRDPVAQAQRNLPDAARAVLAKYAAAKWEAQDGFTDYVAGAPAQDGQPVRAIADSGSASTVANAMEMLCWINTDRPEAGAMRPPVMRRRGAAGALDFGAPGTWGLWCKKRVAVPQVEPRPRNKVPFDLDQPHFLVASVLVPREGLSGVVMQASRAEARQASELVLAQGKPLARWVDPQGGPTLCAGAEPLRVNAPVVLTLASAPGSQVLRVDGRVVAQASGRFAPLAFNQLLLGWGFLDHYPVDSFGGLLFGAIAGPGRPRDEELAVLERYLASLAG